VRNYIVCTNNNYGNWQWFSQGSAHRAAETCPLVVQRGCPFAGGLPDYNSRKLDHEQ